MTQPPATQPEPKGATPAAPPTPTAAPTATTTTPPTTPASPATGDKPLGEAGQKALAEERAARKELEKRLSALEPLTKLAEALGVQPGQGKTDVQTLTDQVAAMQAQMRDSELRALRLEVAAEKGLTPAQAARLTGTSRDELAKDADELKTLFAASSTPGTPAPDPSQGARGGVGELEALLKAAQDKGDTKTAIHLKTRIAAEKARK